MHDLDRQDRRILDLLRADGRMSNVDLAERACLSPSACLRRVRRLEEAGVIRGYAALIDPAALGKAATVLVEITLKTQSEAALDAFEAAVPGCPAVQACYLMAGNADYVLKVAVADAADYERVHRTQLARLPGVANIRSQFALRTIKQETAPGLG